MLPVLGKHVSCVALVAKPQASVTQSLLIEHAAPSASLGEQTLLLEQVSSCTHSEYWAHVAPAAFRAAHDLVVESQYASRAQPANVAPPLQTSPTLRRGTQVAVELSQRRPSSNRQTAPRGALRALDETYSVKSKSSVRVDPMQGSPALPIVCTWHRLSSASPTTTFVVTHSALPSRSLAHSLSLVHGSPGCLAPGSWKTTLQLSVEKLPAEEPSQNVADDDLPRSSSRQAPPAAGS